MGCMAEYTEKTIGVEGALCCPYCGYIKNTPPKEAYHLIPGTILQGKYIVGKVLGYGGFGVTYIGFDAALERKIAIKEYLPTNFSTRMIGQNNLTVYEGENGEQFRAGLKGFIDEARRLSKLNALPGIVDIYDSFLQNETGYIVMEYLDGKTVKEELFENGVFEYEKAKTVILKILETLKEVHKEGIIHRDIAPDNIFLIKNGEVRMIDFGASRYATTLHSKSLSVILKPGYAPEEQYRTHGQQGSWSDMYALAATFYKMITGITPEESMERMMKDDLKEPSKLGVKLPTNDENAIMNALQVKPSDRTQTADEFEMQLTADRDVKRSVSTIKIDGTLRTPKWVKALAACLAVMVIAFSTLSFAGVIDVRSGSFVSAISGAEQLKDNETRVPNLVNTTFEEASITAEETGLSVVVSDKKYSNKVDANKVMTQDPLPGRVVNKGSTLGIVVSGGLGAGIEKGVMPDVVYRNEEEALAMLEEAGISYNFSYIENDEVQRGNISSQDIPAGRAVAGGEIASIVVSNGKFLAQISKPTAGSTPISTRAGLEAISNDLSGNYYLTNDIDLSGAEWEAIGSYQNPFRGTFDGQGYVISNMTITKSSSLTGLFSWISIGAVVKNVGLEGTSINVDKFSAGGICGQNNGAVTNCYNSGNNIVSSTGNVGGICGDTTGTIDSCYNTESVLSSHGYAGGICSTLSFGNISKCYNLGVVSVSLADYMACVGGISGYSYGANTSNCYNAGNVSVSNITHYSRVGGICGSCEGHCTIRNCYNIGSVSISSPNGNAITTAGGIYSEGSKWFNTIDINNCYCNNLYGSSSGTKLSDAQMKDAANFVGFDFKNVWNISDAVNNGYPYLRCVPAAE